MTKEAYDFDMANPDEMSKLFYELTVRVRELEEIADGCEITADDLEDLEDDIERLSKTFWSFVNSWLHVQTAISARLEQATGVSFEDILEDIPKQS